MGKNLLICLLFLTSLNYAKADEVKCDHTKATAKGGGKLVMFIGVDISGSFRKLRNQSLNFL